MDKDFLLHTRTAQRLYHDYAKKMPIYDYHCHLSAKDIAENKHYEDLGEIWLEGDHYKWRAMRAAGISEEFITGIALWREKYRKWAKTVPQTLRNPLYHWTHLELRRYFDVKLALGPDTAEEIFNICTAKLRKPEYSAQNLMRKMNVKVVCTTDDPLDSLKYHKQLRDEEFDIKVLPTFRPDRAMDLSDTKEWRKYVLKLEDKCSTTIKTIDALIDAIDRRHEYFHSIGCRLADHGIAYVPAVEPTRVELDAIFAKAMAGKPVSLVEREKFEAWFLYEVGKMNHRRGWVQQLHLGIFRNNNQRLFDRLGPDVGCDSIADYRQGPGLVKLFDRLDNTNELAKTIVYNSNPSDNEMIATLLGNYQDGSCAGKMQFGSGWWFLDQKDGMERQINALSSMGLLSRFIGMLTDSRSFLSYPRHEYFRRILCNLIGDEVEKGELPTDMGLLGKMIEDICFNNARDYFDIEL